MPSYFCCVNSIQSYNLQKCIPPFWTSQSPENIEQSILPSFKTESLCVQLLQNTSSNNSNSELESQKLTADKNGIRVL